ncbi:hypothetical protein L596_016821 [Steinernema carpocapsae]|uniref:Uncharacterized protein n=1 Tax=Steinernema carpocapsae TaxID=34508 RepID=A0A4U5NKJ9_STECR|nr:hypothetical protein L596_016821 [Steinernema carpocapsae]
MLSGSSTSTIHARSHSHYSNFAFTVFLFLTYVLFSLQSSFAASFVAFPTSSFIVLGNLTALIFPLCTLLYWYGRVLIAPWMYYRRDGTLRTWLYRLRQNCYNAHIRHRQRPYNSQFTNRSHGTSCSVPLTHQSCYVPLRVLSRSMSLEQFHLHMVRKQKAKRKRSGRLYKSTSLSCI